MNAHADRATHAEAIADAIEGAIHLVDNLEAAETLATLADQWRLEIPTNDAQRPSDTTETPEPHTDPTETREDAREAHSDEGRVTKFAEAIGLSDQTGWVDSQDADRAARAALAVADAEQAELRAEVERLREGAASAGIHWAQEKRRAEDAERALAGERARWAVSDRALREATERAEAAEAKVARVEALALRLESSGVVSVYESALEIGQAIRAALNATEGA